MIKNCFSSRGCSWPDLRGRRRDCSSRQTPKALWLSVTPGTVAAPCRLVPSARPPKALWLSVTPGHGGAAQIGPLCQTPEGSLIVCHSRRG